MDNNFKCGCCKESFNSFSDTIHHTVNTHPDVPIDILIKKPHNKSKFGHLTFDVIPKDHLNAGLAIIPNNSTNSISLVDIDQNIELPPLDKTKHETTTSICTEYTSKLEKSCQTDDAVVIVCKDLDCRKKVFLSELGNDLVGAFDYLNDHNQLQNIKNLFTCLANKKLPLNNIAYKLFMDVVSWFSLKNSSAMRYDETVRRFWRTGKQLFKGKFIRFMSGMKNVGQLKAETSVPGEIETSLSEINFIVPSKDVLDIEDISIRNSTKQPGIIEPLIDRIAAKDESKGRPFKLSVDLKKINPDGRLGDVDCFGHEEEPTFSSRVERLRTEVNEIRRLSSIKHQHGHDNVVFKDVVQILSGRLKDLKTLEKKRELKEESGPSWKQSKLAYVLSSIQTSLFEIKDTVTNITLSISNLMKMVAQMYMYLYPEEEIVDLEFQPNYVCLVGMNQNMITSSGIPKEVYGPLVKQRSLEWESIREKARITGSTAYRAVGLDTLKEQKEHFDEALRGKPKAEPAHQQKLNMMYGSENEVNGIATLMSIVMPTFFPLMKFFEEGCYLLKLEQIDVGVVSPDGSLRINSKPVYAVEVKCPNANNLTCKGPYYKPPSRYVLQVLMEMYVLKVQKALLVCWMPKTTTVIEMHFSTALWKLFMTIVADLYCHEIPKRPTKLHPLLKQLKIEIQKYVEENCKFLCEVESVCGKHCQHTNVDPNTIEDMRMTHHQKQLSRTTTDFENIVFECERDINAAYNLSRDFAKQVLVVMLSDLDRIFKPELPHSCPVAYGFTGYSFTTEQASSILKAVRDKCREKGIHIVSQCFDGAFSKLAIQGENGEPLTILQLSKKVWAKSCSIPKQEMVQKIANHCKAKEVNTFRDITERFHVEFRQVYEEDMKSGQTVGRFKGPITIGKPKGITRLFQTPLNWKQLLKVDAESKTNTESETVENFKDVSREDITANIADTLVLVPSGVETNEYDEPSCERNLTNGAHDQHDNESIDEYNNSNQGPMVKPADPKDENMINESINFDEYDIHAMWSNLQELERRKNITKEYFVQLITSPKKLEKLNKAEITHMLKPVSVKLKAKDIRPSIMKKMELVNAVCGTKQYKDEILENKYKKSDHSTVKRDAKIKPLQQMCKNYIQTKLSKQFLNVAYARYVFPDELNEWQRNAPFSNNCMTNYSSGERYWYAQPKYLSDEEQFMLEFLDPEHLLTNMRSKVCTTGIPKAGISRRAWEEVAKHGKVNGSNLSVALVENLVDKQNVAFAQKTFSQEVENAMKDIGYFKEAEFCRIYRNWYRAQDEAGIPCLERQRYEQELRDWLLRDIKFDTFPPPGRYVKDIPIILFEGLMINIDRKAQLFAFTGGAYNSRSLGTLDNENMFAAFQDWDSKGTGVLRAEEVPQALYTACDLYQTRLNEKRGFVLHTSAARVYPVPPSIIGGDNAASLSYVGVKPDVIQSITQIIKRDHIFDMPERRTNNPKRKRSTISNTSEPAKGCIGVRSERYTLNEAKILPHVRAGLQLPDAI